MVDFGRQGGEGSMNWKTIETTLRRTARDTGSNIHARSFFFLTSLLPPLTKGRKQRDEPAVKIADSYAQTELRYDVEMCMFSLAISCPFDYLAVEPWIECNQCELVAESRNSNFRIFKERKKMINTCFGKTDVE